MKEKSDKITSLLEVKSYLAEERAKARKLSAGIKEFESFNMDVGSSKHVSADNRRHHHQKDIKFDGCKVELVSMAAMNVLWNWTIHFGIIKSRIEQESHF